MKKAFFGIMVILLLTGMLMLAFDLKQAKSSETPATEWSRIYGGDDDDRAHSVIQTSDRGYAIAGSTQSYGAGGEDFWLIKLSPAEIPATVDIDPNTLNLKNRGKWITCYIELPENYDVDDINVTTIMLNDTVSAELHPTEVGDYDNDGIPDFMVKLSRAEIIGYVLTNIDWSELEALVPPYRIEATLAVTGKLYDNTPFEGHDTIHIIFGNMPIPR